MSLLIESIKILNGRLYNLQRHEARMHRARKELFGNHVAPLVLRPHLPVLPQQGLYKLRVLYAEHIEKIEVVPYQMRDIKTMRLVTSDINYEHKYADRASLDNLYSQRKECDDIIIVKDGLITDSYYANLVFRKNGQWYTPRHALLKGTRRAQYLDRQLLKLVDIAPDEIHQYEYVSLINAMMGLGQKIVPTKNIVC